MDLACIREFMMVLRRNAEICRPHSWWENAFCRFGPNIRFSDTLSLELDKTDFKNDKHERNTRRSQIFQKVEFGLPAKI